MEPPAVEVVELATGWEVRSSADPGAGGEGSGAWIPIREPMTVGAALFEAGRVPDPYAGDGLRRWPGWRDDLRRAPMPPDSPFAVAWRYRVRFAADPPGGPALLHLDGVNHAAAVWLNGAAIAGPERVRGTFRRFALDVTGRLERDNLLEIEVHPQQPDDLGLTWLDWNPTPPDRNLGLHGAVWIERTGPVAIVDPWVRSGLEGTGAGLVVAAGLRNLSGRDAIAVVVGTVRGPDERVVARFEHRKRVPAGGTPSMAAPVILERAAPWWPAGMGDQPLYALDLEVSAGGVRSDTHHQRFGIREVEAPVVDGVRTFRINGRPVLIRGAGWASDLLLRRPPGKLDAQLALVRDLGLNAIRLEGMVEPDAFHQRCDELGILVLAGWSCCDRWERTADWSDADLALAVASLEDRVRALRAHPSTAAWLYGSDAIPAPRVERAYLEVLRGSWDAAVLAAAKDATSPLSGPTGVKMRGPYAPVSPAYWLTDRTRGGAFGFATEVGPGAAIPTRRGLRALHGPGPLWPIDGIWRFHAGPRTFDHLGRIEAEITRRYGRARDLDDWLRKAHLVVYDGHRAMFEAYRANAGAGATGVVHWMANSAWPSLYWSLWDWDLRPGPAYYGAKVANRPVHAVLRYDDATVVVVNATADPADVEVTARVLALDGAERSRVERRVRVPGGDGVVRVAPLAVPENEPVLVRLELRDPRGEAIDVNTYLLGAGRDRIDAGFRDPRTDWFVTPTVRTADLSALAGLPRASVGIEVRRRGAEAEVTLRNGPTVAPMVWLAGLDAAGEEILPVLWSDNAFALLPGETRTVRARWPGRGAGALAAVEVTGFNLPEADPLPVD